MNIMEVIWENGKKYNENDYGTFEVDMGGLYDKDGDDITVEFTLEEIMKMDFREVFDWSKVQVDTPVWLKMPSEGFTPIHFAKHENGINYVWRYGGTSHTSNGNYLKVIIEDGQELFLTKPEEE